MSNDGARYEATHLKAKCCGREPSFVIITATAASGPAHSEGPRY